VRGGAAQGGHEIAEELVAAEEGQGDGDQGGIQDLPSQHGADARGIAGAQLVRRILRRDGHGGVGRRGLGRRVGPAIEIVQGLAGRRVLDLRLLEGDRPCAQARHERGDVGAMEAQRDARHRERARRGQADEHQGRARPHGREDGGRDQAARDRPHPVGPDVHEGLGRPLPPRRQRRVEELVGGPEDGVAEDGLRAAEDGDRAQSREGRRRRGQERDAQRMHGERPGQAEPRQRPAHERRLHEQGEDARRGLEGGEEPDERLPASQPRDRRRAQRVVEQRLQQRAERDERGQRAKVRGLGEDPHHGSAGAVISGRLLRARGGRRQASHAERAQCDQRGHAEKKGRRRHELRRAPGQGRAQDSPDAGPGADAAHRAPRRVRIERLVDHRPEAGHGRGAEDGDMRVEGGGGQAGRDQAQGPFRHEQGRARPEHPGEEPRRRHATGAAREEDHRGQGEDGARADGGGQGGNGELREVEAVADDLDRHLLRDEQAGGQGRRPLAHRLPFHAPVRSAVRSRPPRMGAIVRPSRPAARAAAGAPPP